MRLEMRIKLILAIAVGLLFCSLATLEFPELLTLSDSTSNDFSLVLLVTPERVWTGGEGKVVNAIRVAHCPVQHVRTGQGHALADF
jgi:hypothetical protein